MRRHPTRAIQARTSAGAQPQASSAPFRPKCWHGRGSAHHGYFPARARRAWRPPRRRFARRCRLGIAVHAHPGLIAAELVPFAVGQVADPIIGQFGDQRILDRRALLDVDAQRREIFGRHADNRHVADQHDLQPGLTLVALAQALQLQPLLAKNGGDRVGMIGRPLAAVGDNLGILGPLRRMCERET